MTDSHAAGLLGSKKATERWREGEKRVEERNEQRERGAGERVRKRRTRRRERERERKRKGRGRPRGGNYVEHAKKNEYE